MLFFTREQRLFARAYWMVNHRWLAVVGVALTTWLSVNLVDIQINEKALYLLVIALIVENLLALWFLEISKRKIRKHLSQITRLIIHFQISCDLTILTGILYFTGGIENPFFLIYMLHMVISSVLLNRIGAFLQTTYALFLFGLLAFLDLYNIIPHHCLCIEGLPNHELHSDNYYVLRTYGVFVFTSYLLVYLTTSIGHRLRNQEDRLTEAIKQLRKNDEIKNQYVLRITHDIKSHLAAIQTSLSVLKDEVFGPLKKKQKEFLERAYRRTEGLVTFSRNLLHLTRLKLKDEEDKTMFHFSKIVEKVAKENKEALQSKKLEFSIAIQAEADNFYGNAVSFIEVLENLLSNAIKYTPDEGHIYLDIIGDEEQVEIAISDTGIGIPADELESIFEEFQRASNTKKSGIQGSGVGLSLVRRIVNHHEGRIRAENCDKGGAKFTIWLPRFP